MAFETKAILMSLAEIACRSETAEDMYNAIAKMANVEGVVMKPYAEAKAEIKSTQKGKG